MSEKVWLITGAERGLGRAIAEAALASGDQVVATARPTGQLDELVAAHTDTLQVVAADVTDVAAVQAAVDTAVERFGRLDVVVNNADYATVASIEDDPIEDFRAQAETNFFGVVNVTKAVLPVLRRQGSGHIVNISSVGGRIGNPGLGAYQLAKWAVNGFTEVLAQEVGPQGIRATAIEPGGIQTDWAGSSMDTPAPSPPYEQTVGVLGSLFSSGAIDSLGDPAKVAQLVLDLVALDDPPVRLLAGSDATAVERDPLDGEQDSPVSVVKRFIDRVINGGDLAAIDELWATDLEWHGGSMGDSYGIEAFKARMVQSAAGSFSDMHLTIHEIVASGDTVVVRFTNSGTQSGTFMGAPATGRHASWSGIGMYTVTDGRISRAWFGEDILGMLLDLGAITLPAASEPEPADSGRTRG